jgi:hypothetical protein
MENALGVTPTMTELPFGHIDDRIRNSSGSIALGVDSSHHGTSSLRPFQYPPSSYSPWLTYHALQTSTFTSLPPLSQPFKWAAIAGNASERLDTGFIVLEQYL